MKEIKKTGGSIADVVSAMRPAQWTKNTVVFAALFFGFWDKHVSLPLVPSILRVCFAAALFCLVSSGIYLINDIRDLAADRMHPIKKNRPIASGKVSVINAAFLAIVLIAAGLVGSWFLKAIVFTEIIAGYVLLQVVYSYGLKHVALADIMVIGVGFVLRAIAGAAALPKTVPISPWLLLCAFLLALFLALCKRRHEKILLEDAGGEHRASLEDYDVRVLDQLIAVVSSATVVCYAIYTLSAATVEKFGTIKLGFTIPFVMFGIFRYLDLVYRHFKGDRPEKILLTDIPIILNVFLYAVSVFLILYLEHL